MGATSCYGQLSTTQNWRNPDNFFQGEKKREIVCFFPKLCIVKRQVFNRCICEYQIFDVLGLNQHGSRAKHPGRRFVHMISDEHFRHSWPAFTKRLTECNIIKTYATNTKFRPFNLLRHPPISCRWRLFRRKSIHCRKTFRRLQIFRRGRKRKIVWMGRWFLTRSRFFLINENEE